MDFFNNTAIAIASFSIWFFIGFGPTLRLLPRGHQRKTFLLAPLIGLCLLTIIGFFELTVLLKPFTPRINVSVLAIISLLLCLRDWRRTEKIFKDSFRKPLSWLWLPPIGLVLVFAWLFHDSGYHL